MPSCSHTYLAIFTLLEEVDLYRTAAPMLNEFFQARIGPIIQNHSKLNSLVSTANTYYRLDFDPLLVSKHNISSIVLGTRRLPRRSCKLTVNRWFLE